ncbi:outer membrane protein assembly factor BamB family protein [Isoptericola aurantiacus]|uniref:outer membrane protein assembly factor BamB family protein n=1 Tax=Isoptericola aurantiacus TaxID=3377839 RepID=UPI00383B8A8C
MARRRDSAVQIDLSPDAPGVEGVGADGADVDGAGPGERPAADEPGWFTRHVGGPLARRWRATSPRRRAAFVALTAVAVVGTAGGVAVLDARADAAHAARMAQMPGGVADLSQPVAETWRVETDGGIRAVLPDGVVVTQDGTDVLALDTATGDEVWRRDVGPSPQCGPQPLLPADYARPVDQVVCFHGRGDRSVTVIDAAGTVLGTRALGDEGGGVDAANDIAGRGVAPMADGAVADIDQVDRTLEAAAPAEALEELDRRRADGTWQDPVLRVRDALTGEVRGEATLRVRTAEELEGCRVPGDDGASSVWLGASVWASPSLVQGAICGTSAVLTADGTPTEAVVPATGGGYLAFDDGGTRLVDVHGEGDVVLPGYVLQPFAIDDTDGPRLVLDVDEGRLAAYDDTGERRWGTDVDRVGIDNVLVRAGGTAVVQRADEIVGLDLESGEPRWTRTDVGQVTPAAGYGGIAGTAATDGSVALVPYYGDEGGILIVALDLTDGHVVWGPRSVGEDLTEVQAVAGHLVGTARSGTQRGDVLDETQENTALIGLAG